MATLWVTELKTLARGSDGTVLPVAPMPPATVQTVDFTSGATASSAFGGSTKFIRVYSDVACALRFGDAPTAVTTDTPVARDAPEYFGVEPGQKVSAVAR